jgi:hypothetical protein
MTRCWGDESWRQVAYEARESYGMKYEVKRPHSHLPEAFRRRLIEVAQREFFDTFFDEQLAPDPFE